LLRIHREVDGRDEDFLVIYHSHTHTEAYPSPTDVRLAAWPDAYYVLVSLAEEPPPVRAFRIVEGAVTEAPIEINPDASRP
jgi:proteasome lid subunit RPN8/RPN11